MTQADLPSVRQLAQNGQITYTDHAVDQMLERDISFSDVEAVLCSSSNQLIEVQSPSAKPGKRHRDERVLISDPRHNPAIVVIFVVLFNGTPELRVVTVEHAREDTWEKKPDENPWLVRIKK